MSSKIKITKRDIKEDKFTTSMLLAKDWLMERWQIVSIAAAIVVVVLLGIIYISSMQETRELEGVNRLNLAIVKMRQQNYQEAIIELGAIVDDYGGGIAARAKFNLGNAHYESRNYDEAIMNYQEYIDRYHSDKITTSSAIAGIAACTENKQEFRNAGDKYTEAIAYFPEGASAPDYYLGAVRCYVLAGNSDRASQMHDEMKEKFASSEYYRIATRLLMSTKIN